MNYQGSHIDSRAIQLKSLDIPDVKATVTPFSTPVQNINTKQKNPTDERKTSTKYCHIFCDKPLCIFAKG